MPALGAGGQGGIGGDPGAIEAAADQVRGGAVAIEDAGNSVSSHGNAVVANWEGRASDAAHERIRFLGDRARYGGDVLGDLPRVLGDYAQALRTAQANYAAGQAAAAAAATALGMATAGAAAVEAETVPGNDPAHVGRQRQAATALDAAHEAGAAASDEMAAAVAYEEAANEVATRAVNAITAQMDGMRTTLVAAPVSLSTNAADWADGAPARKQAAAAAAAQTMHMSPTTADWVAYRDTGGADGDVAGGGGPGRGYGLSPMTEAERLAAVQSMKDGAAGVGGGLITDGGFMWAAIDSLPSIGPDGVRWNYLKNFREDMQKVQSVKESAARLMGADTSSEAYEDAEMAYTVVTVATGVGGLVKGAVHVGEVVLVRASAEGAAKAAAGRAAKAATRKTAKEAAEQASNASKKAAAEAAKEASDRAAKQARSVELRDQIRDDVKPGAIPRRYVSPLSSKSPIVPEVDLSRVMGPDGEIPTKGVLYVFPKKNPTAEEILDAQRYADRMNEALANGGFNADGRVAVPEGEPLSKSAAKAIEAEKKRALAEDNYSYIGEPGHGPDTTWGGNGEPYMWIDLLQSSNRSIGAQAKDYPERFLPTRVVGPLDQEFADTIPGWTGWS